MFLLYVVDDSFRRKLIVLNIYILQLDIQLEEVAFFIM